MTDMTHADTWRAHGQDLDADKAHAAVTATLPPAPAAHAPFGAPAPAATDPSSPVTDEAPAWTFVPASKTTEVDGVARAPETRTKPRSDTGPTGRARRPLAVVLLSILTLGLYGLAWHARINNELRQYDSRMPVHPGRSALALLPVWLAGIGVCAAGALQLISPHYGWSLDLRISRELALAALGAPIVAPYVLLLVPFSCIAVLMTLERLRQVEEAAGFGADVQVKPHRSLLLLLLPVVGGMVLAATVQRRLNRVWDHADSHAARGPR